MTMSDILVLRQRVRWTDVMADLNAAGVSGYRVANLLACEWSTVQRWMQGSEPRHSYGAALLELHTRYCGACATQQRLKDSDLVT